MFRGTFTALVTPFRNNKIDEAAFEQLIESQIENGITGIVPVGTTGESPTLDHDEHIRVIELAVKAARGRVKVIAGTGSNSTSEAIELTQEAEKASADACLLVAPYYNKPSQEGLFRHFKAIAAATNLPIILYSIPGRCGIEIGVETVRRLAEACPNVVAIKESGGSVDRVNALRAVLPDEFDILSGDDYITLAFMAAGARGVVSVATNLIPRQVVEMVRAATEGKFDVAQKMHEKLYPLFRDLFIEPNPAPVKTALAWAGRMTPDVRLPLCEMSEANAKKLRATVESLGSFKKVMGTLRLLVNGSNGRMGQMIIACAKGDPEVEIAAAIDEGDDFPAALKLADVVIDFSHHDITGSVAAACVAARKILVVGTTGHTDAQAAEIREAANSIPVVFAPNFSIGVNTLFWLTRKAAEILGPDFDLEVVEMHHRLKKDAPSGTAKRLAEILAEVRESSYNDDTRHGRSGIVGARTQSEIGVHAIRGGDVVGDHTVIYATQGERLELTHKASSRETFARGAIRAAKWAATRHPGLYDMQDVLGLK